MILSYERTASGGHRVLATPWQLNVSSYLRRPLDKTEDRKRACIPPSKLQRCVYRCNQKPAKTQFPSQPASARHSLNDLQNHPTLPPNSTNNHTKHDPLPNPTHASHHPRHRYEVRLCVTPNMSNKTVEIMEYCCGKSQQIQSVDGCAWCCLSCSISGNYTSKPTMEFLDCVVREGKELNAAIQRTTRCSTTSTSSAMTVKVVLVWKVGGLSVMLGTASWSL